jgi:hypothetical protein
MFLEEKIYLIELFGDYLDYYSCSNFITACGELLNVSDDGDEIGYDVGNDEEEQD